MTTDLQALIQHLRGGDWNLRAPQEMADMIADKLEAALAATPSTSPAAAAEPTMRERLQQKCSDWGTYWRAPDAHGVELSHEQAVELLQDALGVEVEVSAQAGLSPLRCAGCDIPNGCPEYCKCSPAAAAAARIAELEAELNDMASALQEARQAPWPEWAVQIMKTVREYSGYDGYDDASEGVDLPEEVRECLEEFSSQIERLGKATPHPSPSAAEQAGRWVPVKPTKAMHEAAVKTIVRCTGNDDWPPRVWRAMLAAAPSASPAEAPSGYVVRPQDLVTPDWCAGYDACRAAMTNPQPVAPAGQAAAGVQGDFRAVGWMRSDGSLHKGCPPLDEPSGWVAVGEIIPAPAVERGVTIERSVAQEIRETLSTYVTTYNDCWERGMDILEPMGDKALALLDAALSTAGKEQA